MEKIAVIGSNSFSGSNFVNHLLMHSSQSVIGISRSPEYNRIFLPYKGNEDGRFEFFQGDLNKNLDQVMALIQRENVTRVVNFAAQGMVGQSWDNPVHWYRTNVVGVVDLVERLRKMEGFKKYVQISTPEIYGSCKDINEDAAPNPSTPYANSKAAADTHLKLIQKQFGFPVDFVRSTNVYGPEMQLYRIIPRSIIYLRLGKKLKLQGGGKAVKSYIHIRDVCEAIQKVTEDEGSGEVYHISPDRGYSIESIVRKICGELGKSFEESVEAVEERRGQDAEYLLNSDKARKKFNWMPSIGIDEGLKECVAWVDKSWKVIQTLPFDYIHKE